jgi:glycosyltransferase involved in cell wall biosynthesis
VTLICLARGDEELEARAALRTCCHELVLVPTSAYAAGRATLGALASALPFQAAYGSSAPLVREALRRADRHDIVHIEHLRGTSYAAPLRAHAAPVVLDAVDCISLLFERTMRHGSSHAGRLRALLDLARTRRAEREYGSLFERVVVTSDDDAWALQQLQATALDRPAAPAPIDVIPNGVDIQRFAPGDPSERKPATLVFSGKMSYHANEAAALDLGRAIMPLVWRERPDVRCQIVGREPTPAIRMLASDPRIDVTGDVPSIAEHLRRATLAVTPLRYSVGIQNKVLEAMATATPVVATPPAARALGAQARGALALGATPAAVAALVLELLECPGRRNALGAAGRQYVEQHHNWIQSATRFVHVYHDATR